MPIVDNESFQIGGVLEPLPTALTNPLLFDADRAIAYALDFFSFVINTYPGPRLLTAAAAASVKDNRSVVISSAVEQRYPDDPVPYLLENQLKFPCLGVYRQDATYRKHSAGYFDDRCNFSLIYVLPPLTAGQAEAMLPIFRAVEMAIRQKTVQSFDPAYTPPGGTLGQSPWGLQFAAVEEIGFEKGIRGVLPGTGSLGFPFLCMSGFFIERDMPLPAQNKFAGGDVEVDLVSPDGATVAPFIQFATQQAPTVTSLSVTTGSIAGGTAVTITGTLFLSSPAVLFGSTPVTNVVRVSATTITCTTPALSGPGTVGVVVVNRDGQVGTKLAAYAYTSP